MIRHLFKLIWNRKGANFLIILEVFASFLVVFALAATAFHLTSVWREPLGYDWHDVWTVDLDRNSAEPWSAADSATLERLLEAARSHREVQAAAAASSVPYGGSSSVHSWEQDGRKVSSELSRVTPEIKDVLRIDVISGRWFQPGDEALDWIPVVIDQELAGQIAGGGDPLGIRIGEKEGTERRIVGVVQDFRRAGELNEDIPYSLIFAKGAGEGQPDSLGALLLRLAPETPAAFEEHLVRSLQSVARDWSFTVSHMESDRESHFRQKLIPVAVVGVVAVFLLLMVVLGLTGVMWQNVTRRTREFGLRRAVGAHRARIHRQIIGEVAVTAGLGIVAGALLAAQVPLLGPFSWVPWTVIAPALAVAALLILALAAVCGLYPGWSATRVHPAEALHYE